MSEPIVEQIAQWLVDTIGEITVANGYHQTLSVHRPEDLSDDNASVTDLTTVVGLEDPEVAAAPTSAQRFWNQAFAIVVFLMGQGGTGITVDKRINRVRADVEKRLGVEIAIYSGARSLCNNLADWIELRAPSIGIDTTLQATVLEVPVAIRYGVDFTDPYTQS